MMQIRTWMPLAAVVFFLVAPPCAPYVAAQHDDHAHEPLSVDASLTVAEVIQATLTTYPESLVLDARRQQADAWTSRGRSWLLDRPSLMLRYQSDRWGSDNNLEEYEAGIELPLWTWGGRSAVQAVGEALTHESDAAAMAVKWEVAGKVRRAMWDIALAENNRNLAEQSLQMAANLLATVERRHELGDVALRDVLLAKTSQLEQQTALIDASAAVLDAERLYRTYTGLDRRPEFAAETRSDADEITSSHPALALADRAVQRAEADLAVADKTHNAGANVLIGTRHERPAFATTTDDSIGVTVSLPFGGSAHRNTAIATAARAASEARAVRKQQLRQLTLEMHEAAHGLAVVRQNLAAAEQRLEIAERHQAMTEMAYEKGEIELLDLMKIKESALAARRQVTQLQIDQKRQTAFYNQAVGELP